MSPYLRPHHTALMYVVLPMLHTRLSQRSKLNGAPTLLFIAGAALRVADAARILRDKRLRREKGADVAKLFARHFKLEEHVSYLKRSKIGSAIGTPGRIGKLLCETGEPSTILKIDFLSNSLRGTLGVSVDTHYLGYFIPRYEEKKLV